MGIGNKAYELGQIVVQTGQSDRICYSFILSLISCFLIRTHNMSFKFVVEPFYAFVPNGSGNLVRIRTFPSACRLALPRPMALARKDLMRFPLVVGFPGLLI